MKNCPYCKVEKPYSEFYKNKNTSDGYFYECKSCNNLRKYIRLRKKTRERGKGNIPSLEARKLYEQGLKYCSRCKIIKPFEEYHKSKNQKNGIATVCISCAKAKAKIRAAKGVDKQKNRERYLKHKDKARDSNLKKKFGISLKTYNEMLESQGGCCQICKVDGKKLPKSLAVDHCHTTGQVRDLLCANCNIAIGFIKDNAEIAMKIAEYLQRHGGTS